ncbi:MAG: hypothetical protein IPH72_32820 [Sandaracinaceae bacterium]|nr:hypothetical protein [Sandaracinaceae bacterium]
MLAAAAELQSHRSQLVGGQHGESWTVGLVLQVNLFNGLQDLAQRRATEADLEAVRVSTAGAPCKPCACASARPAGRRGPRGQG